MYALKRAKFGYDKRGPLDARPMQLAQALRGAEVGPPGSRGKLQGHGLYAKRPPSSILLSCLCRHTTSRVGL